MRLVLSLVMLLWCSVASANTRDGLVGWWTFDELSGNALDSSWKGNVGTPTGTTFINNCARGGCRNFNGTSDAISVASSSSLNIGNPISVTISLWLYERSHPDPAGYDNMVSRDDDYNAVKSTYGILTTSSGKLALYVACANIDKDASGHTVSLNQWHHIAGTYNGSTITTYIDGVVDVSKSSACSFSSESTSVIRIGNSTYNAGRYVNGLMDDIRVYNRALSAQEIQDLYNQGVSRKTATLNY